VDTDADADAGNASAAAAAAAAMTVMVILILLLRMRFPLFPLVHNRMKIIYGLAGHIDELIRPEAIREQRSRAVKSDPGRPDISTSEKPSWPGNSHLEIIA
jgi:hypothetical protein